MGAASKNPARGSSASLVVLVAVTFLTSLYMKGLDSGIPLHYDDIGYSATVGGTFVAVYTLSSTAMRLVGGDITDRFPHFRVLMASLLGLLIGVAIPALFDNFYVVMACRVIQGASFALAANVMTVAVMGSASKQHLGRRVGLKSAGTSVGTMLGAVVATGLLGSVGFQGFFGFYAATMVVAIAAVAVLHWKEKAANPAQETAGEGMQPTPADTPAGPKRRRTLREVIAPYFLPQVAPYMAMSFARRIPRGFCIAFVLIYAKHAGIGMGAVFFIAAGATTMLCNLLGGKLFDSNKSWTLIPLLCVEIAGFGLLSVAPSFATLIVAAICYGISIGTSSTFVNTLAAKAAPKEHWGVTNGELFFFSDIGKALGAFGGGLIIDAVGKAFIPEIALGFSVLSLAVTSVALLTSRHQHHQGHKGTEEV